MDENKIVAELAKSLPENQPKPEPVEKKPETPQPSAFESNVELNDPAIGLELADFFGVGRVERFSEERQQQLRNLYRWAAEKAGSSDKIAVMDKLRTLEMELGVGYKQNRLDTLARWVKLDRQAETIRREKEFLGHGI